MVLVGAACALVVGVCLYWVVWWITQQLGLSERQSEGWAWIAVVAAMLLSGLAGNWWLPRSRQGVDALMSDPDDGPEQKRRR